MVRLGANERSGADKWFGGVLDACRGGKQGEGESDFLRGHLAKERVRFWHRRRENSCFERDVAGCVYKPCDMRERWGAGRGRQLRALRLSGRAEAARASAAASCA